jgi:hypothetical protein
MMCVSKHIRSMKNLSMEMPSLQDEQQATMHTNFKLEDI